MPKRKTKEHFIDECKLVWDNQFDYHNVNYVNSKTKVSIFCNKHKIYFKQTPSSHLVMKHNGCPLCRKEVDKSNGIKHRKMTTAEFIQKSKIKFGDRFDYSKTEIIGMSKPIILSCKWHGEFKTSPEHHLKSLFGCCPKCVNQYMGESQILSQSEFVKCAQAVHNNRFDYSKTVYTGCYAPIIVICRKHGEFSVAPNLHVRTKDGGCPECTKETRHHMNSAYSTHEYITEARKIWGNRYDYSLTDYTSCKTMISIRCPKHHYVFAMLPQSHLNGNGCPICESEENDKDRSKVKEALLHRADFLKHIRNKREISKEILNDKESGIAYGVDEFLRLAKLIHGEDFDYKYVRNDYKNLNTPVRIICKRHNSIFLQKPTKHLRGQGCPKCIGRERTTESFIQESKEIYGDRYVYSKVNYADCYTKVTLICRKHGEFKTLPIEHLRGRGICPLCNKSLLEQKTIFYLQKHLETLIESQKQFPWLKTTRTMPLDIYLSQYKIAIECQGEQHFIAKKAFGGNKAFEWQKKKDKLKYDLCKNNGIVLFYYSGTTYDVPKDYFGPVYSKLEQLIKAIQLIIKEKTFDDNSDTD